jgi:hypothetical protein
METAAKVRHLARVTEAGDGDVRAEPLEDVADRLRAADRHDGDPLRLEVAATASCERLQRDAVADALDEHDCIKVSIHRRLRIRTS